MSLLAPISRSATPHLSRSVMHHARPPRRPFKPSPLDSTPHSASPQQSGSRTPGTSRVSHIPSSHSKPASQSVVFNNTQGVDLEFHHVPAPSSPSYNTGLVPPILRWIAGSTTEVRSPQATAPFVRPNRVSPGSGSWSGEVERLKQVGEEIKVLRDADPDRWTRRNLMRRFVFDSFFPSSFHVLDLPRLTTVNLSLIDSQSQLLNHPSSLALHLLLQLIGRYWRNG